MRKIIHQALIAAPVALAGLIVLVAQTWDQAKKGIGNAAVAAWEFAVSGPLGMVAIVLIVAVYFAALWWSGKDKIAPIATIEYRNEPPFFTHRPTPNNWHIMFKVTAAEAIDALPKLTSVRRWDDAARDWGADLLSGIPLDLPRHKHGSDDERLSPPRARGAYEFVLCHLEGDQTGPGRRLVFDLIRNLPDDVLGRLGTRAVPGSTTPTGRYLIQIALPCFSMSKYFILDWGGGSNAFQMREADRQTLAAL